MDKYKKIKILTCSNEEKREAAELLSKLTGAPNFYKNKGLDELDYVQYPYIGVDTFYPEVSGYSHLMNKTDITLSLSEFKKKYLKRKVG